MKKWLLVAAILLFMLPSRGRTDDSTADPFTSKASELTAGKTSRLEKLKAIHAFVRDEIAETAAKYG